MGPWEDLALERQSDVRNAPLTVQTRHAAYFTV